MTHAGIASHGISGPDAGVRATLGVFPGTEMVRVEHGTGPRRMGRWLRLAMGRELANQRPPSCC